MQVVWSGTYGNRADVVSTCRICVSTSQEVEIYIREPCDPVLARARETLQARGMHIYSSFDLQTALERLPDCDCPYHGQKACTCQYIVWLVYPPEEPPVLMVWHGRDGETWITVSTADVQRSAVYKALMEIFL